MSTKNFINKQNHVKRPPNSFILWSSEKRHMRNIIDKNKSKSKLNNAVFSKLLGDEWANVPTETKLKYKIKADNLKLEHKIKYPDYKYEPKPRFKPKTKRCSQLKTYIENIKENIKNIKENNDATIVDNDTRYDTSTVISNVRSDVSSDAIRDEPEKISIVNKISMYDIMNTIYIINARLAQDTILDQTTTILMDHILADKTNFNLLTELEL